MSARLAPGDMVRLNSYGLCIMFGRATGLANYLHRTMEVISANDYPLDRGRVTEFLVEVSDPDVNSFLVTDLCFDKVNECPPSS